MITTGPALGPLPPSATGVTGTPAADASSCSVVATTSARLSGSGAAFHGRQGSDSAAGVTGSGVGACSCQGCSAATGSGCDGAGSAAGSGLGVDTASSPNNMDLIDPPPSR